MPFRPTLGAIYQGGGRTTFRVWAPDRRSVELCLESPSGPKYAPLEKDARGYFSGQAAAEPGARYRFRLDGGDCFPDPCSRWQPEGPHGPSVVVDPSAFRWTDAAWKGVGREGQVLYEVHLGAFTPEGTYAAAAEKLPELKSLGITCIELMPLHTCPGRFNWGYDGVDLFAPSPAYGTPDELRRFVDTAHRLGLGVILDVVYNHLGPDGNYLRQYAAAYFTDKYPPEWGEPIRFEGEEAIPVRRFFVENAACWISEYHFDGLRIDATQNLFDHSPRHIVAEIAAAARDAAGSRSIYLLAETEPQDVRLITPAEQGGCGLDAIWVDDFHHTSRVAASGLAEAYLSDYRGTAHELLACALYGSLYQGQHSTWQKKRRGTPLIHADPRQIVFYLQNHDQVANTLRGLRLHQLGGDALARALTTYLLLLPQTPLLFMGQEWFASSPFLFFVDHHPELERAVKKGRERFLSQFPTFRHAIEVERCDVPIGEEAFRASKLDWAERDRPAHRGALALHRELLRLRREDPVLVPLACRLEGAALGDQALLLRWFGGRGGDRLLCVNLGNALDYAPCPTPLLAPPPGRDWRPLLSSEEIRFGGAGARFFTPSAHHLPARSALLMTSSPE